MEKLDQATDGSSMDIVQDNIAKLKQLFPDVFSEGKIDFEKLQETLGEVLEGKEERYNFTWHGKAQAKRIAQTVSTGTLLPCKKESKNWDTTQNLFIEGDNLEVLKLLQKSYHNQVKMIYIDPPYNTGKEFIYPDNFRDNLDTYMQYTGQKDNEGHKFGTNADTSGRYHTNWLNMMYPRLKLARNLLRDDGVIFISIDDNEVANLRKLCDEIFGEENFLGCICVVSNLKGRSDDKFYATAHNNLLIYSKNDFDSRGVPLPSEYLKGYSAIDDRGFRFRLQGLRKRGAGAKREDRPNMFYPFYINSKTRKVSLFKSEKYYIEVFPKLSDGTDGRWRWGKETAETRISELIGVEVGKEKRWDVSQKDFADTDDGEKRIKPKTIWSDSSFSNETGTLEVKKLLGKGIFDTPKPTKLIRYCLEHATEADDLSLDFFSGSCTSAHAIMDLNAQDNSNRKHIMVQLPEPCDEKSEAFKAGYKTIADIGKERIRKAGDKTLQDNADKEGIENLDIGFKVFKLASSNIKPWDADFDNLEDTLLSHVDNIKADRSEEDVLYEILLKYGLNLTVPIEERSIHGKTVYIVGLGALIVCLDNEITLDVVDGIGALKKELEPEVMRVVFKDSGFKDDVVKTNAIQNLKRFGIDDVKSL